MQIITNYQNRPSFGELKIKSKVQKGKDNYTKEQLDLAKPKLEEIANDVDVIVEPYKGKLGPDFDGLKISVREKTDSRFKEMMWDKAPSLYREIIRRDEIFQTRLDQKHHNEIILSQDEGIYIDEKYKDAFVRKLIQPNVKSRLKTTEIAFFPNKGETCKDIINKVIEAKTLLLEELEKKGIKSAQK